MSWPPMEAASGRTSLTAKLPVTAVRPIILIWLWFSPSRSSTDPGPRWASMGTYAFAFSNSYCEALARINCGQSTSVTKRPCRVISASSWSASRSLDEHLRIRTAAVSRRLHANELLAPWPSGWNGRSWRDRPVDRLYQPTSAKDLPQLVETLFQRLLFGTHAVTIPTSASASRTVQANLLGSLDCSKPASTPYAETCSES